MSFGEIDIINGIAEHERAIIGVGSSYPATENPTGHPNAPSVLHISQSFRCQRGAHHNRWRNSASIKSFLLVAPRELTGGKLKYLERVTIPFGELWRRKFQDEKTLTYMFRDLPNMIEFGLSSAIYRPDIEYNGVAWMGWEFIFLAEWINTQSLLAYDTFNREDGNLDFSETLGPDGQCINALIWATRTGTIQVSSARTIATALTGNRAIATIPTSESNATIDIALTLGTGTAGLVLRYIDIDNYLYAIHNGTALQFYKRVDAIETLLVNTTITYVARASIRVVLDGANASVHYNDVEVGSTQSVSTASSGNHGIYFTDIDSTLGGFRVLP